MLFNVFITNLGKYNEGELIGKWLALPNDEIEEELADIGVRPGTLYEEYFITDFENDVDFHVGEYDSLEELNELAEQLQSIDDCGDGELLGAIIEAYTDDLHEAINYYNSGDFVFYAGRDLDDVAREIIEECYNLPEFALRYFDYDAFARDLSFEGFTETAYGVLEMR